MQPHYDFLRFFAIISSWFLIKDLIMLQIITKSPNPNRVIVDITIH